MERSATPRDTQASWGDGVPRHLAADRADHSVCGPGRFRRMLGPTVAAGRTCPDGDDARRETWRQLANLSRASDRPHGAPASTAPPRGVAARPANLVAGDRQNTYRSELQRRTVPIPRPVSGNARRPGCGVPPASWCRGRLTAAPRCSYPPGRVQSPRTSSGPAVRKHPGPWHRSRSLRCAPQATARPIGRSLRCSNREDRRMIDHEHSHGDRLAYRPEPPLGEEG